MHLIGSTGLYGAERWILALLRGLDPQLVQSTLINLVDVPGEHSEVVSAAQERGFTAFDYYTGGKFNPFSVFKMARWLRTNSVHVVHGHGFKSDAFGLLSGRLAGCRVITTPHGWSVEKDPKLQLYEKLDRKLFRFMDMVCPLSLELAQGLQRDTLQSQVRLIPNGVDIAEVEAAERALTADEERFTIGYIGRLVPLKNVATLLRAMQQVAAQYPCVLLKIIGEGPERQSLERLAEHLGILDNILFLGFRDDAVRFLKTCNLFVLPSLSEGIPRCVMEAMAAHVPVIASDIPGNRNLVIHESTGMLFPPTDHYELATQICDSIQNPEMAQEMASNAYQLVNSKFSNRAMAASYTLLYQQLVV